MMELDIKSILKELHTISGFRISLYNTELDEIGAYPENLSNFCSFIQSNEKVKQCCIEQDREAFLQAKKSENVYIYRCRFGLYEAVAPLYNFGVLSGYLMMGQIIDDIPETVGLVKSATAQYNYDAEKLLSAINSIPKIKKQMISSYISIMTVCASYLTLTNTLKPHNEDLAMIARKYINQNFSRHITIEDICSHLGCSRATLMNTFKRHYNITVISYLNNIRLKQSAILLEKTEKPIKQICKECGFADQNYFSKVFKNKYNTSPAEYRKQFS